MSKSKHKADTHKAKAKPKAHSGQDVYADDAELREGEADVTEVVVDPQIGEDGLPVDPDEVLLPPPHASDYTPQPAGEPIPGPLVVVLPPVVVDVPYADQQGDVLHCTMGNWENVPTGYTYQWFRAGQALGNPSADDAYHLEGTDVDLSFACEVVVGNEAGSATVVSNEVVVTELPVPEVAAKAPPPEPTPAFASSASHPHASE